MSGRLLLITGGARSGKSRYALSRAAGYGGVLFTATGVSTDPEMAERIARHRRERPAEWTTIEARHGLAKAIEAAWRGQSAILVEDLACLVSNHLVEQHSTETEIEAELKELSELPARLGIELIVVTNEVGLGIVPASPLGRQFRDLLGLANQRLAAVADEVVLLVAGLPLWLKGAQPTP